MNGLHVFQVSKYDAEHHGLVKDTWAYWDANFRQATSGFKSYEAAFDAFKRSIQQEKLACSTGGCED